MVAALLWLPQEYLVAFVAGMALAFFSHPLPICWSDGCRRSLAAMVNRRFVVLAFVGPCPGWSCRLLANQLFRADHETSLVMGCPAARVHDRFVCVAEAVQRDLRDSARQSATSVPRGGVLARVVPGSLWSGGRSLNFDILPHVVTPVVAFTDCDWRLC